MNNETASIRDLFGENIVLRDLEPLNPKIPGLSKVRDQLSFAEDYMPRKNEPAYVKVVESFILSIGNQIRHVFYVGDSFFNDGYAIKHLSGYSHLSVLGFLCNQSKSATGDFLFGNILFSEDWASLWKLVSEGLKRGITINEQTIGLFDLDNTTYAAKGRESEPLTAARLEAVHLLFSEALGPNRYRKERTERAFREFDRDEFHPYTLDNLDYVVFLALVFSLGLFDIQEITQNLVQKGMASFCEQVLEEVERRRVSEDLEKTCNIVREIHFNMRNGDKTPLKTFRSKEYASTAKWMSQAGDSGQRITITREVLEFVDFLSQNNVHVLALSDRPVEATSPWDVPGTSLVDIPMHVSGQSIQTKLPR